MSPCTAASSAVFILAPGTAFRRFGTVSQAAFLLSRSDAHVHLRPSHRDTFSILRVVAPPLAGRTSWDVSSFFAASILLSCRGTWHAPRHDRTRGSCAVPSATFRSSHGKRGRRNAVGGLRACVGDGGHRRRVRGTSHRHVLGRRAGVVRGHGGALRRAFHVRVPRAVRRRRRRRHLVSRGRSGQSRQSPHRTRRRRSARREEVQVDRRRNEACEERIAKTT
mmetsp:Transcript_10916/g.67444  ORF Transcript_10916/g.67444 Transcript_10916/m.67444 type:complete len:222 (-) Transcript_10916:3396-4061(-)